MCISLFQCALKGANGNPLLKVNLPETGDPEFFKTQYQKNLTLARLIFQICQEAAEAVLERKYKQFDALVKNFGCQVTAVQNYSILKEPSLHKEAGRIQSIIPEKMELVRKAMRKPPVGEHKMNVSDYLDNCPNFRVMLSAEMAQLVRFRFLNLVNMNVMKGDREVPKTSLKALYTKIDVLCSLNCAGAKLNLKEWIRNLEASEARKATQFVQSKAEERANGEAVLRDLLQGFDDMLVITATHIDIVCPYNCAGAKHNLKEWVENLQADEARKAIQFVRSKAEERANEEAVFRNLLQGFNDTLDITTPFLGVQRMPQLYSGELSLRCIESVMVVKNKTENCGKPIEGAVPQQVFIKMPEGFIVSTEEVEQVPPEEPIVVLEGYVKKPGELVKTINQVGITVLFNASTRFLDETEVEGFEKKQPDQDSAWEQDKNLREVMVFDHMYCSSIKEELNRAVSSGDETVQEERAT